MLERLSTEAYFEQGYLILRSFFDPESIRTLQTAFGRLEAHAERLPETGTHLGSLFVIERTPRAPLKIERIVWCGAAEPELLTLGRAPHLLGVVAHLLGTPSVDQLINQAHIKRPGDGVAFSFHQDSYHRRYGTELFEDVNGQGSFVQTLTAVDGMGPDNGGLWLIPGSHRLGHIATDDGRLGEDSFDRTLAAPLVLNPGDTLLLNPFTIHGSDGNVGHTTRRLFINGFCCAGANKRQYHGAGTGVRLQAFVADDDTAVRLKPALSDSVTPAPPRRRSGS